MSIRISKNAHHCVACGVDFEHEATITSTVKKAEGVLHREDFCKDCWRSEHNKEAYSVWNMIYHDPKIETAEPAEVYSPLRQLFYEAAEEESRVEMAKAFLAAGLLRRQKVFRLIKESDESDGNVRVTLYTDRLGNRLIEVPDPQFTYAELEVAQGKLIERLQALEAAAAESETDADASSEENANTDAENPPATTGPEADTGEPQAGDATDDGHALDDGQSEAGAAPNESESADPAEEGATDSPEDGGVAAESESPEETKEAAAAVVSEEVEEAADAVSSEESAEEAEVPELGNPTDASPENVADETPAEVVEEEEVLHAQA